MADIDQLLVLEKLPLTSAQRVRFQELMTEEEKGIWGDSPPPPYQPKLVRTDTHQFTAAAHWHSAVYAEQEELPVILYFSSGGGNHD